MSTTVKGWKVRILTELLLQWWLVSKNTLFSNVYYSQRVKSAHFDQIITSVKTSIKICTFFKCLLQSKVKSAHFDQIITSVKTSMKICTFFKCLLQSKVKSAHFDQLITSVKTSIKKCTFFKYLLQSKGGKCAFWPNYYFSED